MTTIVPPGTLTRARAALAELVEAPDAVTALFARPVLLRPEVVEQVCDETDPVQREVKDRLREVGPALAQDWQLFSVGGGPVERLWRMVEQGDLGLDAARSAAGNLSVTEHLAPPYVLALFLSLQEPAASPTTWRKMRDRGRLLLSALDACGRMAEPGLRAAADLGRMKWTHGLLMSVPDVVLLRTADEAAVRLLDEGSEEGLGAIGAVPGDVHYERAALWSDPYLYGRNLSTFSTQQDDRWVLRGHAENAARDGRPRADWEMPPVADALTSAMEHWRAARRASDGQGTVLVGLAETATYLAELTGSPPDADVLDAVRQGFGLAAGDPVLLGRFRAVATVLRVQLDVASVSSSPLEDVDSDTLVARLGREAGPTVWRELEAVHESDPTRALALAEQHRDLLRDRELVSDQLFLNVAQRLVTVLNRVYGVPEAQQVAADRGNFEERAWSVLAAVESSDPSADGSPAPSPRVAAVVLRLALSAGQVDHELVGLALLERFPSGATLFERRYGWLRNVLQGVLFLGEGTNCFRRDAHAEAMQWYVQALRRWVEVGREELVLDPLARLADIGAAADETVSAQLVGSLAALAPTLGALTSAEAAMYTRQLHRRVLGGIIERSTVNSEVFWAALQLAKGQRTALQLRRTTDTTVSADPAIASLIERLADPALTAAGAQALRSSFEQRRRTLLSRSPGGAGILWLDEMMAVLDPSTLLISAWTVECADRRQARVAYAIRAGTDPMILTTGPLQDDDLPLWPTGVVDLLQEAVEEGSTHLCVVSESGVASLDWHTLELGHLLLADDWVVTLLPHPQFILEARNGPRVLLRHPCPVLSVGIDGVAGGLVPLPNAEAEARAVAASYGGDDASPPIVLCASDATRDAFRRLAPASHRIHVATHGVPSPEAPSFHALLLADGPLNAWEVGELDLKQVDLVTLSACESAETYPTEGDNLEGLPIAFLTAGARTVIGTNAPIRTDASELFFETLHAAVSSGTTDLRAAFRAAQSRTRTSFPDPSVWGAFYLLGDWW